MDEITERLAGLLVRFLQNDLNEQESAELRIWRDKSTKNQTLFQQLTNSDNVQSLLTDYEQSKIKGWQKIIALEPKLAEHKGTPVRSMILWWKYAVAASVFLGVSATTIYLFKQNRKAEVVKIENQNTRFKNDVSPANQSATLQLSDGRKIVLDNVNNGVLSTEGKIAANKSDNAISYKKGTSEVYFQTLSTGKGKDFHLTLADGTEVWLDAMSSIYFPTAFSGKERVVTITGQAYFEVAKNTRQPFRIKVANEVVEVLGTHFNIYAHEPVVTTTLLEGSVRINSEVGSQKSEIVIKPGEQAEVNQTGTIKLVQNAELDDVIAWKNGVFQFHHLQIGSIMKEAQRWYDIDIVYQGKISAGFNGKIPRNVPISKLLQILELTGGAKFRIEGKTITVLP